MAHHMKTTFLHRLHSKSTRFFFTFYHRQGKTLIVWLIRKGIAHSSDKSHDFEVLFMSVAKQEKLPNKIVYFVLGIYFNTLTVCIINSQKHSIVDSKKHSSTVLWVTEFDSWLVALSSSNSKSKSGFLSLLSCALK